MQIDSSQNDKVTLGFLHGHTRRGGRWKHTVVSTTHGSMIDKSLDSADVLQLPDSGQPRL